MTGENAQGTGALSQWPHSRRRKRSEAESCSDGGKRQRKAPSDASTSVDWCSHVNGYYEQWDATDRGYRERFERPTFGVTDVSDFAKDYKVCRCFPGSGVDRYAPIVDYLGLITEDAVARDPVQAAERVIALHDHASFNQFTAFIPHS